MKILKFFAFIALAVLVTACPYSSEIPLSTPNEKVPSKIMGKWMSPSDVDKEIENSKLMPEYREKLTPTYYILKPIDNHTFSIEKFEYNSTSESYKVTNHTAHLTTIGKTDFLNIKPDNENKYYFYKMETPDKESLDLHPVSDYITEQFESSQKMFDFFNQYKELSFFYSAKESYKKR